MIEKKKGTGWMDEWRRNRLTSGTEGVLHMGEKRGGQRHQFSQMDP